MESWIDPTGYPCSMKLPDSVTGIIDRCVGAENCDDKTCPLVKGLKEKEE